MIMVVGAGPAGLAIGYELQRRKLPFEILERGVAGETWRHHYDRLHLHTLKELSSLPGLPMPKAYPRFPSGDHVHAYLQDYARHFQFPIRTGVTVQQAIPTPTGWELSADGVPIECDILVVATGIWRTPYLPRIGGEAEYRGEILHSNQYRNPAPFQGQRVLVVGAGNSGSEIAVDLAENKVSTAIAVRDGATFAQHPRWAPVMRVNTWLFRYLPRPMAERFLRTVRRDYSAIGIPLPSRPLVDSYPTVGFALPTAVANGQIQRFGGIERFTQNGVRFTDGQEASFDVVIMATGYRPTIDFIQGGIELDARGKPRVTRQWQSIANPRLFCIGFWYPTTQGWLEAIGGVAAEAAEGIQAVATTISLGKPR